MKKTFILVALATLAFGFTAKAQTNFQTFYDFGRKHFTTTLEGFHVDNGATPSSSWITTTTTGMPTER